MSESHCWCDHLERWHSVAGVCRWCAKMELRHPQFNFMPRHVFTIDMPEYMERDLAESVAQMIQRSDP